MATTTPNIGLTLPAGTENVSRQVINGNWTIIDEKIGALSEIKLGQIRITVEALRGDYDNGWWQQRTFSIPSGRTVIGMKIVSQEHGYNLPYYITAMPYYYSSGDVEEIRVDFIKYKTFEGENPSHSITLLYWFIED